MSGSSGATGASVKPDRRPAKLHFSQDRIVLSIAAIIFVLFSVALPGFIASKNLLSLLQSVSILGVLTRGVDVGAISEIHSLIRSLADEGLAVLLISSYLPEIMSLSDRILVARLGRVVEEFVPGRATDDDIMYAAVH